MYVYIYVYTHIHTHNVFLKYFNGQWKYKG